MGVPFAAGVRFLLDAHQQFFQAGLPVYLRVKNAQDNSSAYEALGFLWQPPSSGALATGVTDLKIQPQPEVNDVSLANIGLNQARLDFGATIFRVSHSFVLQMMSVNKQFTNPRQVWRDSSVIGIYYDNRLFSIESITHQDAGGEIIEWELVCNGGETYVAPAC